jgi:hypothetical protein
LVGNEAYPGWLLLKVFRSVLGGAQPFMMAVAVVPVKVMVELNATRKLPSRLAFVVSSLGHMKLVGTVFKFPL